MRQFLFIAFLVCASCFQVQSKPIQILTTFSILQDFVQQIGKERVTVDTLVPRNGDPHVYEPKPSDVKKILNADLILMNGLGFEGWLERLIKAAQYKGTLITCTEYIHPRLVFEGTIIKDPHAWHSIPNAKIYVRNIVEALKKIDPSHGAYYETNASVYLEKLTQLDEKIRRMVDQVLPHKRKVITAHDAFGYFGHSYGIQFLSPQGISTDSESKIHSVIDLIRQIKQQKIKTIFVENIADPKIIHQISQETHAKIGGVLYSDALSELDGEAATYIDMMRHNTALLLSAMGE